MARIVVEQSFPDPMSDEELGRMARQLDPCLDVRHATWRRSYLSSDRRRMVCEFEAPDAESVREAVRSAGQRFDKVWVAECYAVEDYPEHLAKLNKLLEGG